MALRVLDGNQSATTLSSVVTGGEHIVAHTVVSLGSNAIADITSAVSGSVVTIPSLARLGNSIASDNTADANLDFVKIGGHQDGQNQVAHIVHVSAGGAMKVDASGSSVTFTQAPVTFGAITGSASILNFPSTQTIAGTVTANVVGTRTFVDANAVTVSGFLTVGGWDNVNSQYAPIPLTDGGFGVKIGFDDVSGAPIQVTNHPSLPLSATVTVGNSVTISSLPAISGTVTANVPVLNIDTGFSGSALFGVSGSDVNAVRTVIYSSANSEFGSDQGAPVDSSNPLPVTGAVAVNGSVTASSNLNAYAEGTFQRVGGYPIGSGSAARLSLEVNGPDGLGLPSVSGIPAVPIAGTVTAAAPNGSLTTRFGTPTTANTAFATAAVTKSDRKYLLIQNVTTGSNVITVGIGFTPTTTQGIQLTAGAGITFESSYIPTGAVYVLSSVTASNFTILEA